MTNILTISPYKEFSSIGEKSFNFISALDTLDIVNTFNVHHSVEERSLHIDRIQNIWTH